MSTDPGEIITPDDFDDELDALDLRVDDLEAGPLSFSPTFRLGLNDIGVGNGTIGGPYRKLSGLFVMQGRFTVGSTSSFPVNDTLNMVVPVSWTGGSDPGAILGGHIRVEGSGIRAIGFPDAYGSANAVAFYDPIIGDYMDAVTPVDLTAPGTTLQVMVYGLYL